ncbi:MAG: hypothetical protein LBN42_01335, partial [Oscillospiraceae bacterium]|nr:hypothetical protein [Oscillospiraceae bacterium]
MRKSKRIFAALSTMTVALSSVVLPSITQQSTVQSNAAQPTGGVPYTISANNGLKNVMYYGDWSIWLGQGNFYPDAISADYLTHLNLAFLDFDADGNLMLCDASAVFGAPLFNGEDATQNASEYTKNTLNWQAWTGAIKSGSEVIGKIGINDGSVNAGIYPALNELRRQYPNVRVGVSVGGWSKCEQFTGVASDPSKRAAMVHNLEILLQFLDMDFIDIDWEYPGSRRAPDYKDNANDEGTPSAVANDGEYFVQLLEDLKAMENALGAKTGKFYELSAALPSTTLGFMKGAQAFLPDSVLQDAYGSNWNKIPTYSKRNTYDIIDEPVSTEGNPDISLINATDEEWQDAAEEYLHRMFNALDIGNLMTYDMRGAFDDVSGHQSPLYSHPIADFDNTDIINGDNQAKSRNFSTDDLVQFLLGNDYNSVGDPLPYTLKTAVYSKKIMLGICIYTRGWEDVASTPGYKNDTYPGLFQQAKRAYGANGDEVGAQPAAIPADGDGG